MPLYAILHSDIEGLHEHSCTLVEAASLTAIAQHILTCPDRWKPLLYHLYPEDNDPCSLWRRIQTDDLTPEALLTLIEQTYPHDNWAEMVRIYPVQDQSLDQIQLETRWIRSDDPDLHQAGIFPGTPNATHIYPASTVEVLIATYTRLRQRKEKELVTQINQLKQQIVVDLQAIKQHELEFTAAQAILLNQLRTRFAIDARSLLQARDFETFIHSIFVQSDGEHGKSSPLQVARNPIDWQLNALTPPLQFQNIQVIKQRKEHGTVTFAVQIAVNLGSWQQDLIIPIGNPGESVLNCYHPVYTTQQWIEISYQLQQTLTRLPITPSSQLGLAQELVCLLAYVGELFNIGGMADQLEQLQV